MFRKVQLECTGGQNGFKFQASVSLGLWWWKLCLAIFLWAGTSAAMAAKPSVPVSAKPEWLGGSTIESKDGQATLRWKLGKGAMPEFYRLTEKVGRDTRVSYVTGDLLELSRFSPGKYRFNLEGCFRDEKGIAACSSRSKELVLTVPETIYDPYLQKKAAETFFASAFSAKSLGPAELRPGRWFNPDKSGIGWSMYWSNRLALSESPNNVFDLQVIWYTYEAKKVIAYCDGPNDTCPPLVKEYLDYRPVVATMNLVKHQSNNTYVGAINIRRKGVIQNVGNAAVSFGSNNTRATIQWTAAFKKEILSGTDSIMLLAGGDGSSENDSSSFAGLWGNSNGGTFVSADIGTISQTLEVVFEDDNKDPTWIMAHRYEPGVKPVATTTNLCYYFTPGGFPPNQNQPALLSPLHTTCDPDNATSTSRNGRRYFSDAETGHFWASFTLPPGQVHDNAVAGGRLSLGTSSTPAVLGKAANRHRIWFNGPASCEISNNVPACPVTLTWFTDSDYPNASAWVHNTSTGQRSLVEVSTAPAMENRPANLTAPGSVRFELYQGSNPSSTRLASSSAFNVVQTLDSPIQPEAISATWTNEATRSFRVDWNHADTAAVAYYQLTETSPAGGSVSYNISPGTVTSRSFSKSTGPWGNYAYRVKACNSAGSCSAETAAVQWLVTDPSQTSSGSLQQPWKSNQYGNQLTGLSYQYVMGYHFTPAVNGQVTQLGGYFSGSKQVKLFRRSNGEVLATATVSSSNSWSFVNIAPVAVVAGEQYTVAAYMAGNGASARSGVSFPKTWGDITILGSAYASTASNPNAVPTDQSLISMYGQVDIGFVAGTAPPPPQPTPPPPPPPPPPAAGSEVAFEDSFEVSEWNNFWTEDSQNDWFRSSQRATEGMRSAEVDGSAKNARLISMPINLGDSTTAVVEFDWYIESGLDSGEYLAFDVSTDGGSSWTEKMRLRGNADQENTWHHERIELSGLSALRLSFRGQMSASDEDANVDNVKVTVAAVSSHNPSANPESPPAPASMPSMVPNAASSRVGATQGQFRVGEDGSANYSIPIMVATGSGGFAPAISLDYSSAAGLGQAGLGWSIGGQSAISRCAQTLEQDGPGALRGITLTVADRFCLDGRRLMLVSGTYGAAGSEYRTEIESFAKVVANGSAGAGPASFTVWRRDGTVTEYGNSADSRIEARAMDNQTVLVWAQNRVSDAAGNYILYHYLEASGSIGDAVQFRLSKIAYTGNQRAGTSPFAELNFTYQESPGGETTSFIAGTKLVQSTRLTRIDSLSRPVAGSTLQSLRSYVLSYSVDPFGRSILGSVKECRDSSQNYCFPPTQFDWQLRDDAINTSAASTLNLPSILYGLVLADTNGDSRPDLVYTQRSGSQYQLKTALAQANGSFSIAAASSTVPKAAGDLPVRIAVVDLNADGRQDLIYAHNPGSGPKWFAQLSGLGSTFSELAPAAGDLPSLLRVMDFDGDGLADLLYGYKPGSGRGQQLVWQRNTWTPGGTAGLAPPQPVTVQLANLFPDGVADNNPLITDRWYINDQHPGFEAEADPVRSQVFDFNGDGAVDLLVRVSRQYCQGQCGFEGVNATRPASNELLDIREVSSNQPEYTGGQGGGSEDMPAAGNLATAAFWVIYQSNGLNNFEPPQVIARDSGCTLAEVCDEYVSYPVVTDPKPADVNADGLADLVYRQPAGGWRFRLNKGATLSEEVAVDGHLSAGLHYAAQLQDFNGDGLPDLAYPSAAESSSSKWAIHYNLQGRGFTAAQLSAAPAGNTLDRDFGVFADFSGDGKLDHVFINLTSLGEVQATEIRLGGNRLASGSVSAVPASLMREIVNGHGARTTFDYRPLTDAQVYTPMQDAAGASWGRGSAIYDLVAPLYVVSQVEKSAPTAASASALSRVEHHYAGAKLQAGGRGSLGFGEVITYDPQSGVRTNTRYRQDFPFIGLPADTHQAKVGSTHKFHTISNAGSKTPVNWGAVSATAAPAAIPSGTRLSHSLNQWEKRETHAGNSVWFPYLSRSLERGFTLSGGFSRKVYTTYAYNNDYGNLDESTVQVYASDGSGAVATQTTVNSYADNPVKWWLGRLSNRTVAHSRSGKPTIARYTEYAYDSVTGILNREITEPGNAQLEVVTHYTLDLFGNRTKSSVKGYGMQERSNSQAFDTWGRYVNETRNAFNQVTLRVLERDVFGNVLESENIDGVLFVAAADHMGRPFISWNETGAWQKTLMNAGSVAQCQSSRTSYSSSTTAGGQPARISCFDLLGREVRNATQGFNGSYIYIDTDYDERGQISRVSEPYFAGETVYWNETAYDALGRISAVESADGNDLVYDYDEASGFCGQPGSARQILVTNGLQQKQLEIRNATGEVVSVYDDGCGKLAYDYDGLGNLTRLTGADGVVTLMAYDSAGRKISLDDDDKGYWQYAYNPLGEMTRQLDSKRQAIDFEYDSLGRVTVRYERSGVDSLTDSGFTTVNSETTTWVNTTSAGVPGKGQIAEVTYRVGTSGAIVQQQGFDYDSFGRVEKLTHNLDGLTLVEETTYDQFGRVFQQFDASGDQQGIRNHYNSQGYVAKVQEAREGTQGTVYQEVLAQDQRGNVTAAVLGDGIEVFAGYDSRSGRMNTLEAYDRNSAELQKVVYSFDVLGNLRSRHDTSGSQNLKESFAYDNLNRLAEVLLSTNGTAAQSTLTLQYNAAGNIAHKSDVGTYSYGQGGAGAHAVTAAGGRTYTYDANGNQVSASDGRSISYTVFDQASRIQKGAEFTEFTYGIANHRVKRVDDNAVDTRKTTWYIGGVERIQYAGENAWFRRTIGGVAIVDFFPATGVRNASFLLKDHIGSIHTVVGSDGLAASSTPMHFSAFGERQNASWNAALPLAGIKLQNMLTTRGFTGHEQVDGLGIVHMNGRIYDPKLGRMLQADPFVQSPTNSQSLNRYSYVLNNPLSYTDPTGYFSFSRFIKRWGRVIVAAVASYFTYGAASGWAWGLMPSTAAGVATSAAYSASALIGGAVSGFVGGAIAGGSLKAAFQGAALGAALAYIGTQVKTGVQNWREGRGEFWQVTVGPDSHSLEAIPIASDAVVEIDGLFVNGQGVHRDLAIQKGIQQLNASGEFILFHNPTHGLIADTVESALGKITNTSSISRQLAGFLKTNARVLSTVTAHSQGSIIVSNALRQVGKNALTTNTIINFNGAAVGRHLHTRVSDFSGATRGYYNAHFLDAVPNVIGMGTFNPLKILLSGLVSPFLFTKLSPHSVYVP